MWVVRNLIYSWPVRNTDKNNLGFATVNWSGERTVLGTEFSTCENYLQEISKLNWMREHPVVVHYKTDCLFASGVKLLHHLGPQKSSMLILVWEPEEKEVTLFLLTHNHKWIIGNRNKCNNDIYNTLLQWNIKVYIKENICKYLYWKLYNANDRNRKGAFVALNTEKLKQIP
jgi:hypothetical protein